MSIDNLTIGQFKELSALMQSGAQAPAPTDLQFGIGKKVIIRTYSAGVWFGLLAQKAGNEVILHGARRLWQWKAKKGISLSAVAVHGIDPKESRVPNPVEAVWLEAIEIIPCTPNAIMSIEEAEHAEAR